MTDLDGEIQRVFRDELAESLDRLAAEFEALQEGDGETQADTTPAMHVAHNLKGAARIAGFDLVVDVAHAMEDVLSALAKAQASPPKELSAALLRGVALLESLAADQASAEEAAEFVNQLRGSVEGLSLPAAAPRASGTESGDAPAAPAPRTDHDDRESSVRVTVARLDRLMASTGELLAHYRRQQVHGIDLGSIAGDLNELRRSVSGPARDRIGELAHRFKTLQWNRRGDLRQLGYLAEEVRLAMRRVRMVPLTAMLPQWRRVVREASRNSGKEVRFEAVVGDVELDRRVLEDLNDPLMHLLRNAVGHGIEAPEDRQAQGKPATGRVQLWAAVRGSRVRIRVSDDGGGIQRERILQIAQDKGMLTAEQGDASDGDVAELLFRPGFSTAEGVGELSGRGFGLDIVRHRIRKLGGRAELSQEGRLGGTTFDLDVPVTLVSTRGLLVRSGQMFCAIPVDHVERVLRREGTAVKNVDGGAAVQLEEGPLRLHWLSTAMGQPRATDPPQLVIVVLRSGPRRFGLVVDTIVEEDDYVAKRLPWNLHGVHGVSGALILADGGLAVVLDVLELMRGLDTDGRTETLLEAPPSRRHSILVVDDSLTSRTLERNILEAAGYEVTTCQDGRQAWQRLQEQSVDLVVTDLQMPNMDGFELTRRVRSDQRLSSLPVVMVSSLGSPEDLAEGASAGADEYIVKGQFDQRQLLKAVERLVS